MPRETRMNSPLGAAPLEANPLRRIVHAFQPRRGILQRALKRGGEGSSRGSTIHRPAHRRRTPRGRTGAEPIRATPSGGSLALVMVGRRLPSAIHAPAPATPARDVEEHPGVEKRQLALIDSRKELRASLEPPVKLKVSNRHGAAREEGRFGGEQADRDGGSRHEFDDAPDPQLGPWRRLMSRQYSEEFLDPVEGQHQT